VNPLPMNFNCSGSDSTHVLVPKSNGQVEIECINGSFQVRWRGNPDCGLRYIGACRYIQGDNFGYYQMDYCNNRITVVTWENYEGHCDWSQFPGCIPGSLYDDPQHGSCTGQQDFDLYRFDVNTCQLTITKKCKALDGNGRETGPWLNPRTIYSGDAPSNLPGLLQPFDDHSLGSQGESHYEYSDFSGVANPGAVMLIVRGHSISLPLVGGETSASVASSLASAINADTNFAAQSISAIVLPASPGGSVQLNLYNVHTDERSFKVVDQGVSGLKVIGSEDAPAVSISAAPTNVVVNWQPTGSGYVLQSTTNLSGGSNSWQTISVGTGSVAVASTLKQQFFRAVLTNKPSAITPLLGMTSWWPADGTANDLISTNHGTFTNGVTFTPGIVEQGFTLDGISGWVDFGTGASVIGRGPFSVSLWLKTTQATTNTLLSQRDGNDWNGMWSLSTLGGRLEWYLYGESAYNFDLVATRYVNDGQPHHIVGTRETDGSGRLYIDGTLETSHTGTARLLVPFHVTLGTNLRSLFWGNPPVFFNGVLDEIQVYGRALTSNEVQTIYAAGSAGMCKEPGCIETEQGVVGHWPADGNAFDVVGHNNGTFLGSATYSTGVVAQAFSFDGTTTNGLDCGTGAAVTGQGPFSVEAWILTSNNSRDTTIVGQRDQFGYDGEFTLTAQASGSIRWTTYGDGNYGFECYSTNLVNDGRWHYIAATREVSGEGRIYIDGALDNSQSAPPRTLIPLKVGIGVDLRELFWDNGNGAFFKGLIDEVRIYNRALTPAEIQSHYINR
jgi:hypothetical protein